MISDFSNVTFNHQKKTIVSIFPVRSVAWRDRGPTVHGGRTEYRLDAAKRGEYVKLEVYDSFQKVFDPMQSEIGRPAFSPYPITAGETVKCLMNEWVFSRLGGASGFRPGIMVIEGDEPTEAELEALDHMQRGYADYMVNEAQGSAERNELKSITDVHRAMARWSGYRPRVGEANWVADVGSKTSKQCVACYESIDIRASICKLCRTTQPELPDTPAVPVKPVAATLAPPQKLKVPVKA